MLYNFELIDGNDLCHFNYSWVSIVKSDIFFQKSEKVSKPL